MLAVIVLLAALGVLVVCYLFRTLVWDAFFSPLARIPSVHWSSSLSPLWILYTRYTGRELEVVHEAHQRLGPVVRVGPRDLSVSCYNDGVRTIYGGGMDKPDYYDFFQYHDVPNSFASKTKTEHAVRRRRVANLYTKSFIQNSPHLSAVAQVVMNERLLPLLTDLARRGEPFCMLRLCWAMSFDYITAWLFGLEVGTNFLADVSQIDALVDHYDDRYPHEAFWQKEVPWLFNMLKAIGLSPLGPRHTSYRRAKQHLEAFTLRMVDNASLVLAREKQPELDSGYFPLVFANMKKHVDLECAHLSYEERRTIMASEMFDHLSGAHEVFGLMLGYTLHFIVQSESAQTRIRAEVRACNSEPLFTPQSASALATLPFLGAAIKESFRMRPNGTPLPRITPKGRTVRLGGYEDIPGDVRVNTYQWFLHRNPQIWPAAEEWIPERHLPEEGAKITENQIVWPFCSGPRTCVGNHMTDHMMRQIISLLMSRFAFRNIQREPVARVDVGTAKDGLPMIASLVE